MFRSIACRNFVLVHTVVSVFIVACLCRPTASRRNGLIWRTRPQPGRNLPTSSARCRPSLSWTSKRRKSWQKVLLSSYIAAAKHRIENCSLCLCTSCGAHIATACRALCGRASVNLARYWLWVSCYRRPPSPLIVNSDWCSWAFMLRRWCRYMQREGMGRFVQ